MNLDLIRNEYTAINVKFVDRKKYYDVFDVYYRNGNADAMTDPITGCVNERLDQYFKILAPKHGTTANEAASYSLAAREQALKIAVGLVTNLK